MKTLFFADMHRRMPRAFAEALKTDGWTLLLPDHTFEGKIKYWRKWSQKQIDENPYTSEKNIKSISYEEFLQSPPAVVMITCWEVQDDVLKLYDQLDPKKTKLVHYAGNNYVPYEWERLNNLITTDTIIYQKSALRSKNTLFYLPWVDFENDYKFKKPNNSKVINSYILNYAKNFPEAYQLALNAKHKLESHGYKVNFIENVSEQEIPDALEDSFATLHIKPIEGYGFSIIESMAKGRPVILFEPFSEQKTYKFWSTDMESCIYFKNIDELVVKVEEYYKNYEQLQLKCSQKVRQVINNTKQNERLIKFMSELK
jgi:hypothetical protein